MNSRIKRGRWRRCAAHSALAGAGALSILSSGMGSMQSAAAQQSAAAPTAAATATGTTAAAEEKLQVLYASDLSREAALAVKVSFEAKRLHLSDLLAELQKQSGVSLSAGENVPAELRITARVREMPLAEVLGTLTRLHGVLWTRKAANAYVATRDNAAKLELALLRVGENYGEYESQQASQERNERRDALASEVINAAGLPALRTNQGVAVAALPPELIQKLRHEFEEPAAFDLAQRYYGAMGAPLRTFDDYTLHIGPMLTREHPEGHPRLPPDLKIRSPQGEERQLLFFGTAFRLWPPPSIPRPPRGAAPQPQPQPQQPQPPQ